MKEGKNLRERKILLIKKELQPFGLKKKICQKKMVKSNNLVITLVFPRVHVQVI